MNNSYRSGFNLVAIAGALLLSFTSLAHGANELACDDVQRAREESVQKAHKEIEQSEHYKENEERVNANQQCMIDLSSGMSSSVGIGGLDSIVGGLLEQMDDIACQKMKEVARNARRRANDAIQLSDEFLQAAQQSSDQAYEAMNRVEKEAVQRAQEAANRANDAQEAMRRAQEAAVIAAQQSGNPNFSGLGGGASGQKNVQDIYDMLSKMY